MSQLLDMQLIRSEPEKVKDAMAAKGETDVDLDQLLSWDVDWRETLQELEQLRAERNTASKEIGRRKAAGEPADELIQRMKQVSQKVGALEETTRHLEQKIEDALLRIPNIPHPEVPLGASEDDNVEVKRWGTPRSFGFDARPHWELGPELGIIDFERAARVAGSRFTILRRAGAHLSRALINFMLDLHIEEHGYEEVYPPYLVNRESMLGAGQLPKFEDDAFLVGKQDYFMIPTAEVPVTNMYRSEIIPAANLPYKFVSYTACFRAEAGAAGRDTRGMIRQHQFDKVELVMYTIPEHSYAALEKMLGHAEVVLQRLELPYRCLIMCTGDMGFAQAKKYDLELWMPSYDGFVEISSVSNFEDFQARRANLRFRRDREAKPEFLHTLNGSGVAVGRTVAAIIENYQEKDGSITIPQALRPYMRGQARISI